MRSRKDTEKIVGRAELQSRPEVSRIVLDDLSQRLAASVKDTAPVGSHSWKQAAPAVAAAILAVVAVWMVVARSVRETIPQPLDNPPLTASEMLTVGHLNAACRRGGLSEVERQCERAADMLQLRPEKVSADELIEELQGT